MTLWRRLQIARTSRWESSHLTLRCTRPSGSARHYLQYHLKFQRAEAGLEPGLHYRWLGWWWLCFVMGGHIMMGGASWFSHVIRIVARFSGHRCFSCCGQTDGLHYDGENSAVEPTIGRKKRWQFQNGRFKGVPFAVVARPCTMHGRCFAIVYADRPMADWCWRWCEIALHGPQRKSMGKRPWCLTTRAKLWFFRFWTRTADQLRDPAFT